MFLLLLKLTITLFAVGFVMFVGGVATLPIHDPMFGPNGSRIKRAGEIVINTGAALVFVAVVLGVGLFIYSVWAS